MVRFASRYAAPTAIRKNSPLNNDELMRIVPGAFSAEKHDSRSERYTYIPTITLLDKLREEGFEPFFASQSRVRDPERREFIKYMVRLRRGNNNGSEEVPEIVLLNSHDGSSSYKMIPGIFRQICTNGLVCWKSCGEISVPHKVDIVSQVIEGAYEVLDVFDKVENNICMMKGIQVNSEERRLPGQLALEYKYDEKEPPVSAERIIQPRAWYDKGTDLWTAFNIVQENLSKGGVPGRTAKGKRTTTRPVTGIDGDIKLNQALWKMAEEFAKLKS